MSNDLPGYARAQAQWEAMEPPDGGPMECPDCNGRGTVPDPKDEDADYLTCDTCAGHGYLTADGEPFDPHAAEYEACEAADRKRDELLTGDQP